MIEFILLQIYEKININLMLETKIKNSITKEDILNHFYTFEEKNDMKIGMEIERLPIDGQNNSIPYFDNDKIGIKSILEEISIECGWVKIFDDMTLIGLRKNGNTITLEPGCQFEISIVPQNSVDDLKKVVENIDKEIKPILKKHNIELLEYGITPKTLAKDIKIYPKKRYQYMAKYLPGYLAPSMMRETAGIQVAIDFQDENDAIKKLRIFTKISPVMTAIFANSPKRNGKLTGYKSTRALAWLNTDEKRCGLISEKLFDKNYDFTFKDYMEVVLSIPMLYFSRNQSDKGITNPNRNDILINGQITFEAFLNNGYKDYFPNFNDYEIQSSLFFPEVRLKNYLEIRNHDCQKGELKYSIPAIYKGLAYDENVLNNLINLFDEFDYFDIQNARYNVPKYALNTDFGNKKVKDLAKEIIILAKDGLKNDKDIKYLCPIENLILQNKCPADLIV